MTLNVSTFPPATHELRPERRDVHAGALDRIAKALLAGLIRPLQSRPGKMHAFARRVARLGKALSGVNDAELSRQVDNLRARLRQEGLNRARVGQAFALIREVAERKIGLRHFDCQIMGGWILLRGKIAEMETGEGKTLTATLTAGTAALAGIPVHVITVNDYLTARDAESMGPVYQAMGLRVGCIVHEMDLEARRSAYECDVTYCTNKEIAFDYLRDRITLGGFVPPERLQAEYLYGSTARVRRLLLRGLQFGIVDEADSVLVDEARTPLVISKMRGLEEEKRFLGEALSLARELEEKRDFTIDRAARRIELTDRGKRRLQDKALSLGPLWSGTIRREEFVSRALAALFLYHRDDHYLVQDGKVQIVDEFTGRVMADRSWEQGLHQLIEIKEGCEPTKRTDTLARISYQRFFRRYLHLAGMTGTAWEVRRELWSVYGLPVVRVPTNRPMKRTACPDQILSSLEDKWLAVVRSIEEKHGKSRPVLVGTRSVAASELLSERLGRLGLDHQVLNAKQDLHEAEIISQAGQPGCVTIATNMAGRGTDIRLGSGVAERQGLHVILTERHEARRIDRQLAGRCGRQGDPGSYEAVLSLEDPLLTDGHAGLPGSVARGLRKATPFSWRWLGKVAFWKAQKHVERMHARTRKDLLRLDEKRGTLLSFSGRVE